ncbi:MAG TPA: SMP-30/gluconolactonase/LRE family protein, partial [Pirellulales bacterium]|nr:SMP-30/gluconolactonase/LRE family protein [Pirellulales bacterium]
MLNNLYRTLLFAILTLGDLLASVGLAAAEPKPTLLASGLKNPESVAVDEQGRIYVTVIGEFDKPGDGKVVTVADGKARDFATGLDDPKGLVAVKDRLYVADGGRVWRIDSKGKAEVFADAKAFPRPPKFLNDVCADDRGTLYVSDSGDLKGGGGAVFRITPDGKVGLVTDAAKAKALKGPNGLLADGSEHLLMLDFVSGELQRIKLSDGSMTRLVDGYAGGDGLARDEQGKFFISQWTTGQVSVLGRQSRSPTLIGKFESAADICLDEKNHRLLVPDMKAGTLSAISLKGIAEIELNERPLPVRIERAFANLEFNRPLVLTHAGDGTNRVFVASQLGKIFVFANDQDVEEAAVYLDIKDRVTYSDNENEEGFLGLAFHPRYQDNGELFVYYTTTDEPHTSVISRFRVSADDPNRADPDSEQELLRIPQP